MENAREQAKINKERFEKSKKTIFEIAPDNVIEDLNKELSADPRFQYKPVIHEKEAYFG